MSSIPGILPGVDEVGLREGKPRDRSRSDQARVEKIVYRNVCEQGGSRESGAGRTESPGIRRRPEGRLTGKGSLGRTRGRDSIERKNVTKGRDVWERECSR